MELQTRKRSRLKWWAISAVMIACIAAYVAIVERPIELSATENLCVGSWAFISPDHAGKTCIVYRFAADRGVREEHYYLTSASPTIPRVTMVGQWSIDDHGRLTIEPNQGLSYARDSMSGWLNEYFDNGQQAWEKPVATLFYNVKTVNESGIQVECSRSGGGTDRFIMLPFSGDPRSVPISVL